MNTKILLPTLLCVGSLLLSSCHLVNRMQGNKQRVKLHVNNTHGTTTNIYLKTNQDWTVLSTSPSMRNLWDADHNTFSDIPHLCYKMDQGTLYIVWFDEDSTFLQPLATDAIIHYMWQPEWNDSIETLFEMQGFTPMPSNPQP